MPKSKGAGCLGAKASGADLQIAFGGASSCQEIPRVYTFLSNETSYFHWCSTFLTVFNQLLLYIPQIYTKSLINYGEAEKHIPF